MKHIISMLVQDEPGVMSKVSGLFSRRGFNIETIAVGKTTKKGISKIVISVIGDDSVLAQVERQANKLIDVLKVMEMPRATSVVRELCLVKVEIKNEKAKKDIEKYVATHKAKIVDQLKGYAVVELIGQSETIDSFLKVIKQYTVKEVARTGTIAVSKA